MDKTHKIGGKNQDVPLEKFVRHTRYGLGTNHYFEYGLTILYASSGRSTVNRAVEMRYFDYYSLAHLYDGEGIFVEPGMKKRKLVKSQGILIPPDYLHYYGQDNGDFFEDNICFAGPVADFLRQKKLLPNGIVELGEFRVLLPICELFHRGDPLDRLKASLALQNLLIELAEKKFNSPTAKIAFHKKNAIDELLHVIALDPMRWWTVCEMAEHCGLEEERFRRLFTRQTGQRPKEYLDSFKIQLAQNWLQKTNWNISKIAQKLGYLDTYHFSRRFKQLSGLAPDAFRKQILAPPRSEDNLTD